MILKYLLPIACLSLSCSLLPAQPGRTDYDSGWKTVDSLINIKGLPKSAIQEVNSLYAAAKKEKNDAQAIRALIYRLGLERAGANEQDAVKNNVKELEGEIAAAQQPVRSILESLLARTYLSYFQHYRWQIYSRTKTANFTNDDIATWGIADFHKKIGDLYLASIQEETLLHGIDLSAFDPILSKGNTRYLRPTLFDLLAHEALDYFKGDEQDVNRPAYAFQIDDPLVFADASTFLSHSFSSPDSLSLHFRALQLFRELIRLHLSDASPFPLLDLDIERMQFAYQYGVMENKEDLFMRALTVLTDRFPDDPEAAEAWHLQARQFAGHAARYDPLGDTTDRYAYLKALDICKKVTAEKDSSEGKLNCEILLTSILHKELKLQTEKVNLPGRPFRSLLSWRNIGSVHFRVIKLDSSLKERIGNNSWEKTYWEQLIKLPSINTFTQALPETGDHQLHSTEIKIDALSPGEYALLASGADNFPIDSNALTVQYFYVSSIAYISHDDDFFVLNRETGRPLAGAEVQTWGQAFDRNAGKEAPVRTELYHTDEHGYFDMDSKNNGSEALSRFLEIRIPGDHLFTDNSFRDYYNNGIEQALADESPENGYEQRNRQTFFFTDRSIYRPGQTVYFKGIVTTRDLHSRQSKILPACTATVSLYNANHEKIDSVILTTNAYGSFHGLFVLPAHQLNGLFAIEDESMRSSASFSVEEYKRPAFYVDYDKLKGSYRLGDSVRIRGAAKAYAGNNIGGATVKYRVMRQARFPDYWLFRKGGTPYSNSQEIAHGETGTAADGSFTVAFLALPDRTVSRDQDPIFDYRISADITDINGETRSGTTSVPVGYKMLSLAIGLPGGAHLIADSLKSLTLKSTNLSGVPEPASFSLGIYKLRSPDRLIRLRYWQEPDQFVMNRSTYLGYFPHDEYGDETNKEGWEKTNEVFRYPSAAESISRTYNLKNVKFSAGWWLIEARTRDKYGQEVSSRRYVELYDSTGRPANPQYQWAESQQESLEPGDKAFPAAGSSAGDLFVIRERNGPSEKPDPDRLSFYTLNNESKGFTIPVTEADRGGFEVSDAFVKDNRVYLFHYRANIPWTNKQLAISYTSYRDKTLPGSEEKWQMKISGYKGDKVAAEVLAGMYDASLDQFKPHLWYEPYLFPNFIARSSWNSMDNFSAPASIEKYMYSYLASGFSKQYDRLLDDPYQGGQMSFRGNEFRKTDLTGAVGALSSNSLSEKVVIGYGTQRATNTQMRIRGTGGDMDAGKMLYIIDGVVGASMSSVSADQIQSLSVLKAADAISLYGAQAAGGAIIIVTKKAALRSQAQGQQIRKNFAETAFFFPDLQTDSAGNVTFSFTMPEVLTRWKWMTLAHTKELAFGFSERSVITQKQLMVQPNAPRFLREGDRMELSAKIVNLSSTELKGQVELQLTDPMNDQVVNNSFENLQPDQAFSVMAGQSIPVSFPIRIPMSYSRPLTYRILAHTIQSGDEISDGEQATLPVLSNRMLVTESLPLNLRGDGSRDFKFDKLLQSGNSQTLQQYALTVEFTSNPAWYAVQALPYLMEYPYECAEQTFERFYANALATRIVNSSPRIKAVFEKWKTTDTAVLVSNLQKNQELKSILLQETPWVLEGKNESQQKQHIAMLFDMTRMSRELGSALTKLKDMQSPDGGFAWFKGGPEDRYITQYILTGIGHLQKLYALPDSVSGQLKTMVDSALGYLDRKIIADYEQLKRSIAQAGNNSGNGSGNGAVKEPAIAIEDHIPGALQVQYLYMRSFFGDRGIPGGVFPAMNLYRKQAQHSWTRLSRYMQGMTALALYRTGDIRTARDIMASLRQNAIRDGSDADKGMYWEGMKGGYYWYEAPVEMQSLMIEAFGEISPDAGIDRDLKTWLLRQKQAHNWPTTKATADACYALLMTGSSWLTGERRVDIRLGDRTISSSGDKSSSVFGNKPPAERAGQDTADKAGQDTADKAGQDTAGEAGTGYFKKVFDGSQVDPSMGNISVTLSPEPGVSASGKGAVPSKKPAAQTSPPAWGAVYWQYFENLDRITPPDDRPVPLRLIKKLFIERNTDRGPVLEPIGDKDSLKIGDKIKVRIVLQADRDLEYVHMKDMRASCMEPENVLSGYEWQGGLGYYESTKDAATDLFFPWLPQGTYTFEYSLFIGQAGNFSNGITSIECMYAPEFSFHSEGIRVNVRESYF